jgi:hypothetical protein
MVFVRVAGEAATATPLRTEWNVWPPSSLRKGQDTAIHAALAFAAPWLESPRAQ